MSLKKYKQKRQFTKTPEPAGKTSSHPGRLRFVVQKHDASRLHYDFRLELNGVLKSWAVPKGPSLNPKDKRLAMMVEDHPFEYKDFEGIIPEGNYGAGSVMVWDEGTYHAIGSIDPRESSRQLRAGLAKGSLKFFLNGEKLKGGFALVKIKNYQGQKKDNSWLLIKERDEYAEESDVTSLDRSAKSSRTMEEIASKSAKEGEVWHSNKKNSRQAGQNLKDLLAEATKFKLPQKVKPMMATLVDRPFDRPGWLFEIKWDGFRAVARVENNKAELFSRSLLKFKQFQKINEALGRLKFDCVLDGEVVVVDDKGKSEFQLLQNFQNTGKGNLVYYVFDILSYNGLDLLKLPLWKRKEILKSVLPHQKLIKYSDHVEERGEQFFELAKKQNLEGIIAKDMSSTYQIGKRGKDWLKIKARMQQEAVIVGFTEPLGSRSLFGALVLGVYENDKLLYIGHAGTGFSEETLKSLYRQLKPLIQPRTPFAKEPKTNTSVTWVKPQLVCEVGFAEWTSEGQMRQPVFLGLRPDKKPKDVKKEIGKPERQSFLGPDEQELRIGSQPVKVTNLNKIYWPDEALTKGELIEYYRKVAPFILPYLKGRPETLHRFPNGIEGESFYQKDVDHKTPDWVRTQKIRHEGKSVNYLLIENEASLVYAANLGCIEINPFNSTVERLDQPDYLVIDLDPEDILFEKVIETAQTVHKIFESLGVPNFCKTSGATGLHIYVPMGGKYTYEQTKQFARIIATLANSRLPEITSLERSPKNRQKKVYLDYLQNNKGQTLASAYSVRPVAKATVSAPLSWNEVRKGLTPQEFTIKTVLRRFEKKGDLFRGVLGKGINLEAILKKINKLK
ncbi:MAG: DNA ligase D [Acidobacteriaceae bacterium]